MVFTHSVVMLLSNNNDNWPNKTITRNTKRITLKVMQHQQRCFAAKIERALLSVKLCTVVYLIGRSFAKNKVETNKFRHFSVLVECFSDRK